MIKTVTVKTLRHVDALIAVNSANWNWFRNVRDPSWHSILDMRRSSIDWEILPHIGDETSLMGNAWDWKLPKFSTEMPAVWTEVERLVKDGFFFDLKTYTDGDWKALLKEQKNVGRFDADEWEGYASTPQLAICKAILSMNQIRLVLLCNEEVITPGVSTGDGAES